MTDANESYDVRVCEFATHRSFDVQLTAQSSVAELKQMISQLHERRPDESIQKLVLLGKPLNDPSGAAGHPTAADPIMMHPIMAAAYNAALCELANGNLDSSRLSAVFPQQSGSGTRHIPLAIPAPLHLGPHSGGPRAQPQTIVINAQNLHLDGNNATSLRALLSRANVNIHQPGAGARGGAAQGARGARGRGAAAQPRAGVGVGVAAGVGVGGGDARAFQRDPDGALRLQMRFQLNLMEVVRGILAVIFMHLILGLSILKVLMLVGTYFMMRALLRLNLHRGIARWFDDVAAFLMRPPGGVAEPAAAGDGPAAGAVGGGAEGGVEPGGAAGVEPGGEGGAARPPPAPPQPQPAGTLRALVMGLCSFFLSLLPQFNARGADGDAIAAAQEELNNQNNDNDAAMAF
eukprot:jgi/Ulvmu1/11748/UM008_0161.1